MSARFTVTPASENAQNEDIPTVTVEQANNGSCETKRKGTASKGSLNGDRSASSVRIRINNTDIPEDQEAKPLTVEDHETSLYKDEFNHRPRLASIINRLTNYRGGDITLSTVEEEKEKPKRAKLGTLLGVYLPTLQNIFGVLLFIRLTWIVGSTGALEGFTIVLVCCCCTMLTAISMSAIATNGVVPGGGSYFMISRSLGPEFGGAVGILFYLGTSFAAAMYIIGAVEILLFYMERGLSLFGDVGDLNNAFNNYRVYGSILLVILFICVFLGVRFVSIVAAISLGCVIISIISIYIGIFVANPGRSIKICLLGDVLLSSRVASENGTFYCSKNDTGPIYRAWCPDVNGTEVCDPYFLDHDVIEKPGIPGFSGGVFTENLWAKYPTGGGLIPGTSMPGDKSQGSVVTDMGASFVILLAIFFPSCTGIMAGSNRSGDLEDAQKSIPVGTIAAIATTGTVYLSSVLFQCAIVEGALLRDKFGESINDGLIVAHISWPNPWVVVIGSFLSTIGAGLQSLTGAPRLLQAIAKDNVIPFLRIFAVTNNKGEPIRALFLTAAITELGIIIASLDAVAPIITMFFLMCYGFVNLACALQTLLKSPSWRPRFRFYHWTLSLLGLLLCIVLMFISSVVYALCAIFLAGCIYKYIEYKGAEQEWGDGISGLAMSAARYALLQLQERPPHTKNWRPQILILLKPSDDLTPKHPKFLSFASQLKAGKGLVLATSILDGDILERKEDRDVYRKTLQELMESSKVKGFAEVLVGHDIAECAKHVVQISGLGGMKQNTVLIGWPYNWRRGDDEKSPFLELVRVVSASQQALLVIKGVDNFPENSDRLEGTIDIWWIVHDGGMLMLLPFLLMKKKVWKNCKMRLFTVAQLEDNSIQIAKDLKNFLYQLRMEAEVQVVEMTDKDISAYTYERTLIMEQRTKMLKDMKLAVKKKPAEPQSIMDLAHKPGTSAHNLKVTVSNESGADHEGEEEDEFDESQILHVTKPEELNLYTFSAGAKPVHLQQPVDSRNVRRMHNAVRLNEAILENSHDAQLVILNLPGPPKTNAGDDNYMEFLEVLTEGLDRVLMVRGGGMEVITIFS